MRRWGVGAFGAVGAWLAIAAAMPVCAAPHATAPVTHSAASHRIVAAANAFLATLSEMQRTKVLYAFNDSQQRARWSNFPTAIVPRGGIGLKDLTAAQRDAALKLLATVLSRAGYDKVQEIMEGDEVNKRNEEEHPRGPLAGGVGPPPGMRGPPPTGFNGPNGNQGPPPGDLTPSALFGRDLYYLSILGTPAEKSPWMLQFGGHHLALNITIAGDKGVLTPTLTGAQPALYVVNGTTVRPLRGENDKAVVLLKSLTPQQRSQAVLNYRVPNLVLGPGEDGKTIQPEGLQASALNTEQRAMLLDLITEWSGIIEEGAAAARRAELEADLNDTWFAWSGATDVKLGTNISAYYRIQGPHLVIEYAPQGDDPTMHVHTMYRDPTNDYGAKVVPK